MNINDLYKVKLKEFKNGKIKMREYENLMIKPKKREEQKEIETMNKNRLFGEISKRSLSRTRNNLIELVENNDDVFESFITLTYKDDVEDIDEAYNDLRNYIRNCKKTMRKENIELSYIAVPEIQHKRKIKTGKYVIHFHLITNIKIGSHLIPEREKKFISGENHKGTKTIRFYDLEFWDKGYSFAMPIIREGEFELSKYLLKYLYKDLDNRFYGRQKILHSNNLKVPEFKYYLDEDEIKEIKEDLKENINEVFRMDKTETREPFVDYVYIKSPNSQKLSV